MPRLLVTGATGFVGEALLQTLPRESVRAATRKSTLVKDYETVCVGEIGGETEWQSALRGIDTVIHLAARVHVMTPTKEDRKLFHDTNVVGTERLAFAAAAAGVKRFVFLSSVKVNGEGSGNKAFAADDDAQPVDDYGVSKYEAERRLFDIAAKHGMEAVSIRSPLVYGPGVRANFLRLMSWVHKDIPLPFGAITNRRSLVSVWNLCDLIACVALSPNLSSGVLMASDGHDLSTPELIRKIAASMGRKPRLIPIPVFLLKAACATIGRTAEIDRLTGSLTVDIAATKTALGWAPPLSVDESLERTVRWYLDEATGRRA